MHATHRSTLPSSDLMLLCRDGACALSEPSAVRIHCKMHKLHTCFEQHIFQGTRRLQNCAGGGAPPDALHGDGLR